MGPQGLELWGLIPLADPADFIHISLYTSPCLQRLRGLFVSFLIRRGSYFFLPSLTTREREVMLTAWKLLEEQASDPASNTLLCALGQVT